MCVCTACPWKASIEGAAQHLVQARDHDEVQIRSHVAREILQVLFIALRQNDTLHSRPVSCQHLVLNPTNLRRDRASVLKLQTDLTFMTWIRKPTGSTSPLSVISPVIATSDRTSRPLNREARHVTMVTPAEGPSLVTAPAGKWRWMSVPSNGSRAPTTVPTNYLDKTRT